MAPSTLPVCSWRAWWLFKGNTWCRSDVEMLIRDLHYQERTFVLMFYVTAPCETLRGGSVWPFDAPLFHLGRWNRAEMGGGRAGIREHYIFANNAFVSGLILVQNVAYDHTQMRRCAASVQSAWLSSEEQLRFNAVYFVLISNKICHCF